MTKLKNIHSGEILLEEFLSPLKISAYKLAKDVDIPQTRVSEILKGNRRITADTALRLSKYFGYSAKFWLGLQDDFDIEEASKAKKSLLSSIKTLKSTLLNIPFALIQVAVPSLNLSLQCTPLHCCNRQTASLAKAQFFQPIAA